MWRTTNCPLTLVITEMRFVFRTVRWISELSEMFLDWRLYCAMSTGNWLQRRGVSYRLFVQGHSGSRSWDLLAQKAKRIQSSETSTTICRSVLRNMPEEFYVLLTVHLITVFINDQLDAQFFFLYLFIPILYMFRATKCLSSEESIVSIWPVVYVTLCG